MKEWRKDTLVFSSEVLGESYPGIKGRNTWIENAQTIKLVYQSNGSGPNAYGGAERWPGVSCDVSFQEGQEEKARTFYSKLKVLIEEEFRDDIP